MIISASDLIGGISAEFTAQMEGIIGLTVARSLGMNWLHIGREA